jgi:hypothetical protein
MRERWEPIEFLTRCKYCGKSGLGWVLSKKGSWYLCEGRRTGRGFEACPSTLAQLPTASAHPAAGDTTTTTPAVLARPRFRFTNY